MKINNKGAALIMAYFVMSTLVTLSAAFSLYTFNEINNAHRYRDATTAFWLAEAGINEFINNPHMLDKEGEKFLTYENGTVYLKKDDSLEIKRILTAVGKVRGSERQIQVEFPALAPDIFNNSVATKGSIRISGDKSNLTVNGKLRISGKIVNSAKHSTVSVEDKIEGVDPHQVALTYPDVNGNGRPDEFRDFVDFNRDLISKYSPDEVVYIKGDGVYTISPNSALKNKKIIYVEGSQGDGNVNIEFNGAWEDNQNLTIISTGTVTYSQANPVSTNSQLNIIAWAGYAETAALPGSHYGMIFTHGVAQFDEVRDTSITNGVVIANGGISVKEVWSNKTFNYADPRHNGVVPPGFEGLLGGGVKGYTAKPSSWAEI